jgi:hypothetical protein
MDTLFHRFQDKIKGVLEGFDRIVFKGTLRPLCFALGMQAFLRNQGVLNKNYKEWCSGLRKMSGNDSRKETAGKAMENCPGDMLPDRQSKSNLQLAHNDLFNQVIVD